MAHAVRSFGAWKQSRRNHKGHNRANRNGDIFDDCHQRSLSDFPIEVQEWLGHRISLNTIANRDWLKKKKELWNSNRDVRANSADMRRLMQDARKQGAYRNYTGLVVGCDEFNDRYMLMIRLDESCRDEDDLEVIRLQLKEWRVQGRWDNWQRMPPNAEDLMEMMTSEKAFLREFAVKYYKENNEAVGTVLEFLTKMDNETRLEILQHFCRICGGVNCNCG